MQPPASAASARPGLAPGRGLLAGLAFGASYLAVELIGTAIVFEWMGGSARVLATLHGELLTLLAGYLAFGAVVGLVLSPAVWLAERMLPPRWRGPGIHFMLLAWTFIGVAFLWNPESILPRRAYAFTALGALALILVVLLLARAGARAGRALPRAWRWPLLAAFTLATAAAAVRSGAGGGVAPVAGAATAAADRPNVVLVVVDTLRRDHVSAYGYGRPTSPWIDRIAAEGVLFERAYSTASWTLPAHASLFTGLYTSTHETDLGSIRLAEEKRTVAEILRAHGYRAGGFSANPWLNPQSGLEQGFERLDYVGGRLVTGSLLLSLAAERWRAWRDEPPLDLGGSLITDRLLRWIGQAGPGPFFVFANYMEAHEPYGSVPEPYFSRFSDAALPRDVGRAWLHDTALFFCRACEAGQAAGAGLRCDGGRWQVEDERRRQAEALYDAGILYVDAQIGRIYAALEQRGLLDRTLVIVTADHGETLGERGEMGHGTLYNSVLEIPLVVRYPRLFPPGTRVSAVASLVDVLPTIEDAAGLSPSPTEGTSLVPARGRPARPVLAESAPFTEKAWRALGRRLRCDYSLAARETASLQSGSLKLIWSSAGDHELFDVASDPREESDLLAARPEDARRLEQALRAWRSDLRRRRSGARSYEVDPATRRALESLGYVH